MLHARPRWAVSASGWAVPDRVGPAWPPNPSFLLARPPTQTLTFIDGAKASPAPTPHFYWPDPTGPRSHITSLMMVM